MEFEDGASRNSLNISVRFVLLLHVLPAGSPQSTHWDLMIHQADSLLTFAMQSLPPRTPATPKPESQAPHSKTPEYWAASSKTFKPGGVVWPATRLPNHRLRYLDYEGLIAAAQPGGPHRGSVRRVAAGWAVCEVIQQSQQPHRWQLTSPELQAAFAYKPCAVGQATQLHIEAWNATFS